MIGPHPAMTKVESEVEPSGILNILVIPSPGICNFRALLNFLLCNYRWMTIKLAAPETWWTGKIHTASSDQSSQKSLSGYFWNLGKDKSFVRTSYLDPCPTSTSITVSVTHSGEGETKNRRVLSICAGSHIRFLGNIANSLQHARCFSNLRKMRFELCLHNFLLLFSSNYKAYGIPYVPDYARA